MDVRNLFQMPVRSPFYLPSPISIGMVDVVLRAALADAVHLGLIASEARPGGNVTGIEPLCGGIAGEADRICP